MARVTDETLLISAAINSKDPYFWKKWQVSSRHFHGYRDEAEWVEQFGSDYIRTPSWEEFTAKWPSFPASLDQEDGKYPAVEVIKQYNTRIATRSMLKAGNMMRAGEADDGLEVLRQMDVHKIVDAPKNALDDYSLLDSYHEPQNRIEVPWRSLQDRTLGIGAGELWYIAARPSQGKSMYTTYMAAHAALKGHNVVIYSMEMSRSAMLMRLHVMMGALLGETLDHQELRTRRMDPRKYKKVLDRIKEEVPGTVFIHTPADGPCRPSVVAARASQYDLNIIDYIGLMRPDGHGRAVDDWRTMAAMSNELKEIALARNTAIVSASQINREGDGIKPPKLSQLSQSDALGQDGDVVLTLTKYRKQKGASHFSIEKNREGEAQVQFWTKFDTKNSDFREITRDEADEIADEFEYEEE